MKSENPITWFQVNNVIPIVTSIILMVIAFGALKSDVTLLNQKMDFVIAQQEKILVKYDDLERRYGNLALEVNKISTEHAMKKSK